MPTLRLARPLWLARAPRAGHFPRLAEDLRVEVAIVGGGMTGAAVAWRFAEAGVRVALVESSRVGFGSTAASTALLMQEPDSDFIELVERYGARRARRIWQLSRRATQHLRATLRRLDIHCDLVERDSIYYTSRPQAAERLRREYMRRKQAKLPGRWLDASSLHRATGIEGAGAIRTSGNAQVDPYRACLGLARAARREGALVFERTAVRRIDAQADQVAIVTTHGTIRANRVVIATGYATPFFKPLAGRFRMKQTYVIATRRMTARERGALGLGDVMLWDTARPYHYARWTPDHRLLMGGADRPAVGGRQRVLAFREGARAVHRHFQRLFPPLATFDIDLAWEGLFATTPDALPYIGEHSRYPRHLFALGYGGNGMTFGFLAAEALLDCYRGARSSDRHLFAFDRGR